MEFSSENAVTSADVVMRFPAKTPEGIVRVRVVHSLDFGTVDNMHRLLEEYRANFFTSDGGNLVVNEAAHLELWKKAKVTVSEYKGFPKTKPLTEEQKEKFLSDPVYRTHAVMAVTNVANELTAKGFIQLAPLPS